MVPCQIFLLTSAEGSIDIYIDIYILDCSYRFSINRLYWHKENDMEKKEGIMDFRFRFRSVYLAYIIIIIKYLQCMYKHAIIQSKHDISHETTSDTTSVPAAGGSKSGGCEAKHMFPGTIGHRLLG